jgi:AcrR family transcriptional regulator
MGRPREFDTDEALDRALDLFWRRGFAETSLSDLTEALGVTRPSLYAAFGNKDDLFRKVLDRYSSGPARFIDKAFRAGTAAATVSRLLRGAARFHGDPSTPPGCLMVHGALAGGAGSEAARRETRKRREDLTRRLGDRLREAQRDGELPGKADPRALALYVVAVLRGMAVEAAGGAGAGELRRIAETALKGWPGAARG